MVGNYRLLNQDFSPFLTFGLLGHYVLYDISTEGGFTTGSEEIALQTLGANSGLGISYLINEQIQLRLGLNKNVSLTSTSLPLQYWQSSFTAIYSW